ncbi:MAG: hypothetical protein P1V20_27905, partial [Verrucomicrobiales bacterium]|nr:hypothetical protein [Verrucomicrobiales bacterium]
RTLPRLPVHGSNVDPVLKNLRLTWKGALGNYNEAYDEAAQDVTRKFAASLAVFETELTKERKIELAKVVHKYRRALLNGEEFQDKPAPEIVGPEKEQEPTPRPQTEPEPVTPPAGELVLAGQYEAVPLKDPVFPLPMRKRPNEPCKVVAWRLDGKPVKRRNYETCFFSTPSKLGTVVDLDVWEKVDRGMQHRMVALTAEGKVRTGYEDGQRNAGIVSNAVQVAGKRDVGIALLEDGTCQVFPMWSGSFGDGGWNADVQRARNWKNIVSVDAGERHVLALGADGTPYAAGDNNPQKGATVPAGIQKRTVSILARDVNSIFFALGSGGNIVEMHHANRGNQISRRIPRANRFFGHNPRIADKDGNRLDMNSASAHVEKLIGAKPANVTFAQAVGGNYLGEQVWAAWLREGNDDWRFWADLGDICSLDSKHCSERAKGCRKVFLNPPYAIGLKPVTRITSEDWTGAGEDDSGYKEEPVTAVPEYRDIFPLAPLERSARSGAVEIFRRDGKPLNPNDPELKQMPEDLGDQVVDIKVQASSDGFVGIVLLQDGSVRAWGTRFSPDFVDLTKLTDVVQIRTGHHRFVALESNGDLLYWGPEGLRSGRMNEANEPVRRVAMTYNDGYFLTESGKVGAIQDGPGRWLAKDIPPAVALVSAHKPFVLGIDGKWRSWSPSSKGWTLAAFESGGLKGVPHSSSNEVWWIDKGNRLHKVNQLGAPRDVGPFQNKEAKEVQGSAGFIFIKNQLGRWEILGGDEKEREFIEAKIGGSRIIEITKNHVFCVK